MEAQGGASETLPSAQPTAPVSSPTAAPTVPTTEVTLIPHWIQLWKESAEAAQASATAVGLLAAGVWTYLLFVRNRERYPKARVEHVVNHWRSSGTLVLRLTVRVMNQGKVVISIGETRALVQALMPVSADQVSLERDLPLDTSELDWPVVGTRECCANPCLEVEPGETEELHFDFLLPHDLQKVSLYSYLRNQVKSGKEIGWNTTTVYSCREDERDGHETCRTGGQATAHDRPRPSEADTATAQEGKVTAMAKQTTQTRPTSTRQGPPKAPPVSKPSQTPKPKP